MVNIIIKKQGKRISSTALFDELHFGKVVVFKYGHDDQYKYIAAVPFRFTGNYFRAIDLTSLPVEAQQLLINRLNRIKTPTPKNQSEVKKAMRDLISMIFNNDIFLNNIQRFYYTYCKSPFIRLSPQEQSIARALSSKDIQTKFF